MPAAGGAPDEWRIPEVGDVAVTGGGEVTPEFIAVLLGLVLYTHRRRQHEPAGVGRGTFTRMVSKLRTVFKEFF